MVKNIILIAEIGWNHLGNLDLAEKMIIEAAKNGADICKFQSWDPADLKKGDWDNDGRKEIYKKAALSINDHQKLKSICDKYSVKFMTSIFHEKFITIAKDLDKTISKIPSHEVHNEKLVKKMVESFDITLISTGASYWKEILNYKELFNSGKLIPMHCVSSYPCIDENINLPRINKIKEISQTYGYSGHLKNINDAIAAICFGCQYIEKHFTIDKSLPGRDNLNAILPNELKELYNFKLSFQKMNIDRGNDLQNEELDIYNNYRGRWGG
tara:strand:+ start:2240 stop:3049 length:810 start_codon:yes stop_codon:yes gene_type:complete